MEGTQQQAPILGRFGFGPKEDAREADLVATWFARIGALAVLVGAGFGYKFAVDRGLIGPGGRVALGAVAALALILGGEVAARRGWNAFAQAVMGGGTALLYLTVWAAFRQYALIDAPVAFAFLAGAAGVGAVLALRHDSQPLAMLATIGAFANPIVAGNGAMGAIPAFGYILTVDLCVLGLAYWRNWETLTWVGAIASWILFADFATSSSHEAAIAFASTYHLLFAATAVMSAKRGRSPADVPSLFLAFNVAIYAGALILLMTGPLSDWLGATLGVVGIAYLGAGAWLRKARVARTFVATTLVIGATLVVGCVPIQFDLHWIPAIWAAEGACAIFVGYRLRSTRTRMVGATLMAASVGTSIVLLGNGMAYVPDQFILSTQSLAFVVHSTSLFAGAFALLRFGQGDERQAGILFAVVANAMTLVWMSLEATAYVNRSIPVPDRYQTIQFLLTIVWALYACTLVTIGVVRDSRTARWLGVGLFGGTIVKLVVSDVWLLSTGYRTLVFIGVGGLLLLCSLQYSRFNELLTKRGEPDA